MHFSRLLPLQTFTSHSVQIRQFIPTPEQFLVLLVAPEHQFRKLLLINVCAPSCHFPVVRGQGRKRCTKGFLARDARLLLVLVRSFGCHVSRKFLGGWDSAVLAGLERFHRFSAGVEVVLGQPDVCHFLAKIR